MMRALRLCFATLLALGLLMTPALAAESGLIKSLLEQLPEVAGSTRPKLAVLDLVDLEGQSTKLGSHLAEDLLSELFASKRFVLLERSLIQQVIKEQGFSQTALADAQQLIELGRLSGAQQLLTGRYSVLPDQIEVTLRLLDTSTGEILALSKASLPKTAAMRHLNGEVVLPEIVTNTGRDLLQSLTQLVPEAPSVALPASRPQRVFYEDFGRFPSGTQLPDLGPHLMVRTSQRYPMHVLTSEHPAANSVSFNLAFPQNFIFEIHAIDTLIDARQLSMSPLSLMLVDSTGKSVMVRKQAHGFAVAGSAFGPGPWRYQDWNVIALVRQGARFRLFLNGQPINEALAPEMGEIVRFHLLVPELRQWAFTRFALFQL